VSAYKVTLSEQVDAISSVYALKLALALQSQDQTYLIPNGFAGLLYISGNTAPRKMARLLNMTMTAVDRPCLPVQIMTSQEDSNAGKGSEEATATNLADPGA